MPSAETSPWYLPKSPSSAWSLRVSRWLQLAFSSDDLTPPEAEDVPVLLVPRCSLISRFGYQCVSERGHIHRALCIWWRLLLRRMKPKPTDPVHEQPQHRVFTPALLVVVPHFLKLFHLQQPEEGVSQRATSVSHIPTTSRCT